MTPSSTAMPCNRLVTVAGFAVSAKKGARYFQGMAAFSSGLSQDELDRVAEATIDVDIGTGFTFGTTGLYSDDVSMNQTAQLGGLPFDEEALRDQCGFALRPSMWTCPTYVKPTRSKIGRRVRFADSAEILLIHAGRGAAFDVSPCAESTGYGEGGVWPGSRDSSALWEGHCRRALTQAELDALCVRRGGHSTS
eukprot:TRINITY_DN65025_c0_g1_i1.p1 TRINITY_DN65025_c0_g1~~TRINITY_DN65025_c0_g1_i1.p1  ORF type:complete len:208 (+),score=28.14 TRINITY_DN65025_c0_g1_i1:45-626(+)